MSKPTRVIIVEDNPEVLQRFTNMIVVSPHFQLVAACDNATDASKAIDNFQAEVLLTDLGLPDGNGLDLIRQAYQTHPDMHIMVISVFGDEKHVVAAIEAGATGYILKDDDLAEVEGAILQMCAGGSPISPAVASHLLKRLRPETDSANLTKTELEVLQLIAKGFTAQEVADMKHVSYHTVTSHIKNIYRKLHISTRAEAVQEAIRRRLL